MKIISYLILALKLIYFGKFVLAEYRKTCYFTNWSQYREGYGKFSISDIDVNLCTHLVYSFSKIDDNNLMAPTEWNDLPSNWDIGMYARFTNLRLKNPNIVLLLAVGGWTFDLTKMTYMLTNAATRSEFIRSAIQYLRKYSFDGLDLDFEYPARSPSPPTDREKFTLFVKELRQAFNNEEPPVGKKSLLLSIAVPGYTYALEAGFEIATIAQNVDYVTVMTYDFAGSWSESTGHNSALYPPTNAPTSNNINSTIDYMIKKDIPLSKLNLGIATYGVGFILSNPANFSLGAPFKSVSPKDEFTKQEGFLSYYEILQLLKDPLTKVFRPCDIQVPYLVKGNLWVGYDDEKSMENKNEYIVRKGLGGYSVWAIDFDDFNGGLSSYKPYPLLTKLSEIEKYSKNNESVFICNSNIPSKNESLPINKSRKLCYFTNWSQYREGYGKFSISDIDVNLCTHIAYSFCKIDKNLMAPVEWNDFQMYTEFTNLRLKNPNIVLLLAIGGWNFNLTAMTYMLTNTDTRSEFIRSAIQYLRKYSFDGLDLDFEYPARSPSPPTDREKFTLFVKELRQEINNEVLPFYRKSLLLSIAVPGYIYALEAGFEMATIAQNVDFVTVMTYDFAGSWSESTGHNSALYPPSNAPTANNINSTIDYMIKKNIPLSKLNLGIPTYGVGFILSNPANFSLGAPIKSPSPKGEFTKQEGILSYYEILQLLKDPLTKVFRPCDIQVPYLVKGNLWVGYDDEKSMENKIEYIVRKELGGYSIWAIDFDDFKGVLSSNKPYPLLSKLSGIDQYTKYNDLVCDTLSTSSTNSPTPSDIASRKTTPIISTAGSTKSVSTKSGSIESDTNTASGTKSSAYTLSDIISINSNSNEKIISSYISSGSKASVFTLKRTTSSSNLASKTNSFLIVIFAILCSMDILK